MIVYSSESLALAGLEVLVHCDFDLVPSDLMAIELHIPDGVRSTRLSSSKLPRNWRKYPAPTSLQEAGNAWLDRVDTCIMQVPSVVIPTENNFLINPRHPDIKRIKVARKFAFKFDRRLVPH